MSESQIIVKLNPDTPPTGSDLVSLTVRDVRLVSVVSGCIQVWILMVHTKRH